MAHESLPPQSRRMALYAAGGGFGGALLAILIAKILTGPCCCQHEGPRYQPASVSAVMDSPDQRPHPDDIRYPSP